MKAVSNDYKNNIKQLGRELDSKISYTSNDNLVELGVEDINSINLHYEGGLLKSVMKQLDIDSNTDIPLGTILNFQFGVLVGNSYEYINYGNFVVKSSEKQEALGSYKITCYDKLLYSMVDYEDMGITYPISIRTYLYAICTKLGLTFANENDTFVNYDKLIQNELYLDADGNSLNYTFRDVLDELSQVTASNICINNNDELEIRYINDTNSSIDAEYLKDINVNFKELYGPINTITLKRSEDADTISLSQPVNLPDEDKIEIVIRNNQILNGSDRADYMSEILTQLYGLQYYTNEFASTGITFYELCDKYDVLISKYDENGTLLESNTYGCIMFNDEINITQGLVENIHTEIPDEAKTDYSKTTKDDRTKLRTELIVNKQEGRITGLVSSQDDLANRLDSAELELTTQGARLDVATTNIDPTTGDILELKRTGYQLGANGLVIDDEQGYKSVSNTTGTYYYDNDTMIGKYTKDGSVQKDFALFGKYYYGIDEGLDVENFTKDDAMFVGQLYEDNNNEVGFGHFWNGN